MAGHYELLAPFITVEGHWILLKSSFDLKGKVIVIENAASWLSYFLLFYKEIFFHFEKKFQKLRHKLN